jgi:hypothetical protein
MNTTIYLCPLVDIMELIIIDKRRSKFTLLHFTVLSYFSNSSGCEKFRDLVFHAVPLH